MPSSQIPSQYEETKRRSKDYEYESVPPFQSGDIVEVRTPSHGPTAVTNNRNFRYGDIFLVLDCKIITAYAENALSNKWYLSALGKEEKYTFYNTYSWFVTNFIRLNERKQKEK